MNDSYIVCIAEDVHKKCSKSFLAVLTTIQGSQTAPRLIRFDLAEGKWTINEKTG